MSILASILSMLAFTFSGMSFDLSQRAEMNEHVDVRGVESPGPMNPCTGGCR